MGVKRKLKQWVKQQSAEQWREHLELLTDEVVTAARERHVRLAITGLSQSGKTVLTTALVHHLLQSHKGRSLPFFEPAAQGRILSVKAIPEQCSFPYEQAVSGLTQDPPQWPASTADLSQISLAIHYRRSPGLARLLGETATVYLDLIDYPGEWLLDLPLMRLDYAQWCEAQTLLWQASPRAELAAAWRRRLAEVDWYAPADDALLADLGHQYRALLQALRGPDYGMSLLQPGRTLLPGHEDPEPLTLLFPIIAGVDDFSQPPPKKSALAEMMRRFERYRDELVKPFYRRHFARFDRQLVLVDCLKTLNRGEACFKDMQQALGEILQSFHYGQHSLLRRLFKPRIDKVVFASSKADHVTANQHHNLDQFLGLMIEQAQRQLRFDDIDTQCMALASVRSTQAATADMDGQVLSCLKGYRKSDGQLVALFPGEVPTQLPEPKDWTDERFRFVDFAPVQLPTHDLQPQHHIRLDQMLDAVIGDYF